MNATLAQDVINIINEFKKQVNPGFVATPEDIEKIKVLITEHSGGRCCDLKNNIYYTCLDYDGMKRHNVKDFSFSAEDYELWSIETLDLLKAECIAKRRK